VNRALSARTPVVSALLLWRAAASVPQPPRQYRNRRVSTATAASVPQPPRQTAAPQLPRSPLL